MADTTGFLLYIATVIVLTGSVVLADITRSVTVTETSVTLRVLGLKVSVAVADVRRIVREHSDTDTVRVVVLGRRPWHSVRVEAAAGSDDEQALGTFLQTAGRLGAPVSAVPARAA